MARNSANMNFNLALTLALTLVSPAALAADSVRVEVPSGITAQFDAPSGRYEISLKQPAWAFSGTIGQAARQVSVNRAKDRLGYFQELNATWGSSVPLTGTIRVYEARPVVLFTLTCGAATDTWPAAFPCFTNAPKGLRHFSYRDAVFAPPSFTLEHTATPWLLFDDQANAAVISPADHFMLAAMTGDGVHEIACGLNDGVRGVPARFTCSALLAFGHGINAAWDTWGGTLTELAGKVRVATDADAGLRYLGYWTDNGATYYYRYDPALGYAGTLESLVKHYRAQAVPIRYLQLDSWWYWKSLADPDGKLGRAKNPALPEGEWNRYGGLLIYGAHPAVFPDGLAAFQKKAGLPLITHNRWMDPASPYHASYNISGYAVLDPQWWNDAIRYIAGSGVVCYEQDWLSVIYQHSPVLATNVTAGDAFTDAMARAAQRRRLTLQYCMALPRFFLQSTRYSNLTTIRVSEDRFRRDRWDAFLYTSRLAGALGVRPWCDVFMSSETNNLLLAALSSGMVGIGDALGQEDKANLLRVARPDGVLVKPDVPIVPLDAVYLAQARGDKAPMIAWTCTDHGPHRTAYVFVYNRSATNREAAFAPADLGFTNDVRVVQADAGTACRLAATGSFSFSLAPQATAYYIVTPVGKSGIAFFGDEGKFVSNGRQRIATLEESPSMLTVSVRFSQGEKPVRLFGYAERAPVVEARRGTARDATFDAATGRFTVEVSPSNPVGRESPGGDLVQTAVIRFTRR